MRWRQLWDNYWTRAVGGSVALFGLLPALMWYFFGDYSLGVYIGTGVAVLWYTVETYYLRQETARHNALAIQPVLVTDIGYQMSPEGRVVSGETMLLRNIGAGPAVYVQIEDLVVDAGTHLFARFETANVVRAGEEVRVNVNLGIEEGGQKIVRRDSFLASLKRAPVGRDYDVLIRYRDLGGRGRETVIRMGKSGVQLVSHG